MQRKRVPASCGSFRDDTWVDMDTKGVYTVTATVHILISLYIQKGRNRIACSVIENRQYIRCQVEADEATVEYNSMSIIST